MKWRAAGAAVALATTLGTALAVVPTATAGETPCASEFGSLKVATMDAAFTSKRATMDEQGLLDKISAAQLKVDRGKLGDAVAKVADYDSKVRTLESTGKMSSEADLHVLADVLISCIRSIP